MHISVLTWSKFQDRTIPMFDRFFTKYWPGQSYRVVSDREFPGPWGTMLKSYLDTLSECCTIVLMDDYLLVEPIDTVRVQSCWDVLETYSNVGYVRLNPCPGPELPYDWDYLGEFNKSQTYLSSLQPCIWRVDYLRSLVQPNEDPWDFETNGTKRARDMLWRYLGTYKNLVSYQNWYRRGKTVEEVDQWIERQSRI
jgi:hypothetical protein